MIGSERSRPRVRSKRFNVKHLPGLLKETFNDWRKHDPWQLSIGVAFYVMLAMPGLLVIILNAVGAIWGEEISHGRLSEEIADIAGEEAANAIQMIIEASRQANRTLVSTLFGISTLVVGTTGAFYHIQVSLNHIWGVKPAPDAGAKKFITDRLLSFSFVLLMGLLMLVSFLITTLLSFLNDFIRENLPQFTLYLAYMVNELFTFAVVSLFFALLFRFLPDAKIRWKTVWIGGVLTALLFTAGKFFLALYFGRINPASAFGAAGSMVLIMLWVTYSALIFFFGAQFTFEFAKKYGRGIKPKSHAVKVKITEEIVEHGK